MGLIVSVHKHTTYSLTTLAEGTILFVDDHNVVPNVPQTRLINDVSSRDGT
jgi:hypothetical protein